MASGPGGADRRSAAPHRGGSRPIAPTDPATVARDGRVAPTDPATVARDICLRLLQSRPRTRAELEGALRRRRVTDEIIAEVLDRYSDVGMIDDEAFARAWVTSRHHSRGLAGRALAGELRRKGVPAEAVAVAVDDLDAATEEATARAMVERRLRTERAVSRGALPVASGDRAGNASDAELSDDPDAVREKRQREHAALARRLVGMLARKGYPPSLAYRVVREVLADKAAATDTEALVNLDQNDDDFDDFDQIRS